MKNVKLLLMAIAMIASYSLTAQIAVSTDGTPPDGSAMLDVKSTDKGVLMPRLTQTEIAAIVSPAVGLIVFNTDDNRFYFFDGGDNDWKEIAIGAATIIPGGTFTCGSSTISDGDGNTYSTVLIGTQCWTAKDLATTKYKDGTDIPLVTDNSAWGSIATPGYCWYNNDEATYGEDYGALYNWYTVNTGNLCPDGWHVPSDAEVAILNTYLGNDAGGKLKEVGLTHWNDPNFGATNETDFNLRPGGFRPNNGIFAEIGNYGSFWTTTESWGSRSMYWYTSFENAIFHRHRAPKNHGWSIRCIKD